TSELLRFLQKMAVPSPPPGCHRSVTSFSTNFLGVGKAKWGHPSPLSALPWAIDIIRSTETDFAENQLYPILVGLSPLATSQIGRTRRFHLWKSPIPNGLSRCSHFLANPSCKRFVLVFVEAAKHQILGGDQLLVILCGFGTKSLEFGISFLSMTISGAARCTFSRREEGKLSSRSLLVFPSSRKRMKPGEKEMNTLLRNEASSLFFFKAPIRSRSPLLTGSRLISLPLATQMFQFAKFEKSKERRLATELGYGFPIGDPWITDGISPWPFASESVLPSQCPGIHPMHSFRSYLIEDIALERDTKSLPKIEREAIPVRYWSCGFFLLVDFFLRDTLVRAVNPLRQEMRASQSLELPDANNSLEGVESLFFWYKSSLLNETS
ncbi:hypothetical protein Tco_0403815, partial [Tanacetum coccineum]